MRIPDDILKCVGFVSLHVGQSLDDFVYEPDSTGLFVAMQSERVPSISFTYFVTARHIAAKFNNMKIEVVVNAKDGSTQTCQLLGDEWVTHPTDETADVAVLPCQHDKELDVVYVPYQRLLTHEDLDKSNIGLGDEIFMAGLFSFYPSDASRNLPIVRMGNIAMLPSKTETLPLDAGSGATSSHLYLTEARSIGGLSGSPVFVRKTFTLDGLHAPNGLPVTVGVSEVDFYLLGMMQGHWDVRESDINKHALKHDERKGVNLGIAKVVPAYKIKETLDQPVFERTRRLHEDSIIAQRVS